MRRKQLNLLKSLLQIAVASVLYAAGISFFLDPNNLAPGGVTGISVILNRLTHVEVGTIYFLLNVPLVLLGMWKFGLKFILKTAYTIVMTSSLINLLSSRYGALTDDPLLAALAGSILIAGGIGLVFKAGALKKLLEDLDVGITYLQGRGGWTGEEKEVICCVIRKALGPRLEEIVKEEDPTAFMIITSANEIYGEGYKDLFAERL